MIKQATAEQLRNLICAMYSPRCSNDCPLRDKVSCECKKYKIVQAVLSSI